MKLFEPGRIGNLPLKNRIIMAAMDTSGLKEPDGTLGQRAMDYYLARARGGVGMIIHGSNLVIGDYEAMARTTVFDSDVHLAWMDDLVAAMHDYDVRVCLVLSPGRGRCAAPDAVRVYGAVAPSPVAYMWNPAITTHELTIAEIERFIAGFEFSARLLKNAGIDAVELNSHCGYIFDEFLTPLWNKRTDRYGGSLENRLRFIMESIEAIRRG
ncbi:MAG: 2-enoate reductase, partial [Chloroflexota bacterium]